MHLPNYEIVEQTHDYILIRDIGPWNIHKTVTNDAENVVFQLVPSLKGRRLLYIDSDGEHGELLIKDGKFNGFSYTTRNYI